MDTLVVGYGKIGRIKSFIWHSLGRTIYVYDTDARKTEQAKDDGFKIHRDDYRYDADLMVDISTPASFHLDSLKWVLDTITPRPKAILIEKPLASHQEELDALMQLLVREHSSDFRDKLIVNESYYLSSALEFVVNDIKQYSSKIVSIRAELSKNRLDDVLNGRFVDEHLGSLGIELPHMIAMVQRLGFNFDDLSIKNVSVYQAQDSKHNEGFKISLASRGIPVTMESYLGDFRICESDATASNDGIVRTLEVRTNARIYKVEFDPIQGIGRYKARVCVRDSLGNLLETTVLDDNHLANHLKKIHQGDKNAILDKFLTTPTGSH